MTAPDAAGAGVETSTGPRNGSSDDAPAESAWAPRALTPAERELWLATQVRGDLPPFTTAHGFTVDGEIDAEAMAVAWDAVVRSAPHLTARIEIGVSGRHGEPMLVPRPDAAPRLAVTRADGTAAARARIDELRATTFDPEAGPLASAELVHDAEREEATLAIAISHLAVDGYAWSLLLRELQRTYAAVLDGESPRPASFASATRAWQVEVPGEGATDAPSGDRGRGAGSGGTAAAAAIAPVDANVDADAAWWAEHLASLPFPTSKPLPIRQARPRASRPLPEVPRGTPLAALALAAAALAVVDDLGGRRRVVVDVPFLAREGEQLRAPVTAMNVVPIVVDLRGGARGDAFGDGGGDRGGGRHDVGAARGVDASDGDLPDADARDADAVDADALLRRCAAALEQARGHAAARAEVARRAHVRLGAPSPVADVGLNVIPFPHELRLDGRRARVETLASGPGDADAIGVRAQPDGGYVVETDARADAGRTADSAARSEALADRFVDAVAALVRGESPAVDVTVRRARRPGLEHVSAPAAELEPKPAPAPSPASAPVSVPRPVSVPSGAIAQGESGVGVLDRVRLRAETAPDAPAFVSIPSPNGSAESSIRPSIDLTYGELWRRALGLADRLRARGIGRDRLVGVIADRGPDHAVGALGALIAGAAFVPMPAGPGGEAERRRIAGVVRLDATFDATREPLGGAALGAVLDVTSGATPGGGLDAIVEPGERGVRPARDSNPAAAPPDSAHPGPVHPVSAHLALAHPGSAHPDQLAYVITTSGSTGAPKPVAITRGALDAWVDAILRDYLPLGPSDRVAQFAAVQFDASIEELFGALCSGAALVPRSGLALERIGDWLDECAAAGVTVLDLPTGYWHEVVVALATGTAALPSSVHTVIIGGEAASPERVRQWCELVGDAARLVNTYGPTEATVVATRHVLAGPALAGA